MKHKQPEAFDAVRKGPSAVGRPQSIRSSGRVELWNGVVVVVGRLEVDWTCTGRGDRST